MRPTINKVWFNGGPSLVTYSLASGIDPTKCGGYWSPITASGPESALSGVLAGFVFTAITVVLTTNIARHARAEKKINWRSYALQLFFAAFIGLALDSYFASITAGELACNRAYAESALSGGTLGDGAILMIAGLGCLIATFPIPESGIEDVLLYINRGVWTLIIIMLAISSADVGDAMLPNQSHVVVNLLPAVLAVALAALVFSAERISRRMPLQIMWWVRFAALSGLGAAIFAGLFTGIASAFGATWWTNPPAAAVYAVTALAMLVPAVPLLASVPVATAARDAAGALRREDGKHESVLGAPSDP